MTQRYLPLYRKYRPQTFKDLIGQENIVKALTNAINLNKISHAYLLCGPRGTGKTTTARIIAKSLNCAKGPTLEPCGECPSCKDIANSTPIDVIEIDAASNRKVEDARNILEKIQFVPVNGRYKIYIIDEVHMLTTEAFNTLLKTLEEPPENVIFILATTEPHKVLDTIISRCQRFDFRRITTEDIVARLKYISQQENINITDEALFTIARSSAGGMRDSLALLDQISVLDADKEITPDDVNEMLGRLSFETLFDLSSAITNADTQKAITLLDSVYNKGNEPFQIITNLIQYFRNLLVVKNCADRKIAAELTQLAESHILQQKEQSQTLESEQILYIIERLSFYSKEIKDTTNRYLWLELCVIELSSNVKFSSYSQLLERIERLESGAAPAAAHAPVFSAAAQKPAQVVNTAPAALSAAGIVKERPKPEMTEVKPEPQKIEEKPAVAAAQPQDETSENIHPAAPTQQQEHSAEPQSVPVAAGADVATVWSGILQNITSIPSRMFFYNLSRPLELTPDGITIGFGKEIFVKQAQDNSKNAPLKKAAMAYFGVSDINIHIKLVDENEMAQAASKPAIDKLERKQPSAQANNNYAQNDEAEESIALITNAQETSNPSKTDVTKDLSITTDAAPSDTEGSNGNNMPVNISDRSRMVMELFNGKFID